ESYWFDNYTAFESVTRPKYFIKTENTRLVIALDQASSIAFKHEAGFRKWRECKLSRPGTSYQGKLSTSRNHKICQRWDSQTPHRHNFTDSSLFPDDSLEMAGNACRNPDNDANGPWCLVSDHVLTWDYCDIDFC
ncbi:unnamed protein product, partial [Owenia fusiformis]